MALNVGHNADGTCFVSDDKRDGTHWALLTVDLINCKVYYGDSLGWTLPNNLEHTVVPNLKKIEGDLGIDIPFLLKNVMIISDVSGTCRSCSNSYKLFYLKQSCSNICGIVVVCMVGVLCDQWDLWLTWDDQTRVPLLSNPTMNSRQLRLIAMSWIVNHCVKTHYFDSCNDSDSDVRTFLS